MCKYETQIVLSEFLIVSNNFRNFAANQNSKILLVLHNFLRLNESNEYFNFCL